MRSRIPRKTSFLFMSSLPFFRLYLFRRVLGCFIRTRERARLPRSGDYSKARTFAKIWHFTNKNTVFTLFRFGTYLDKVRVGRQSQACHTSRKSDGGRDSQCITVYADGKCGYVRDGKPVCPIWSDPLRLAPKRRGNPKGISDHSGIRLPKPSYVQGVPV